MAFHSASSTEQYLPEQANLLAGFDDPVDCLTAHLMFECAEVLAGAKPANLISLVNRTRACGRNLYQLWNLYRGQAVERLAALDFIVLQSKERALMVLCYNKQQLEKHLAHAGIRVMLQKAGYSRDATINMLLADLKQRIADNGEFPHEIGLFIGYPAKDVAAFMGLIDLPFACQGPWKIFGNPVQSLDLARQFRCCRQRMGRLLATGSQKLLQLENPEHPFFCTPIDSESHIPDEVLL